MDPGIPMLPAPHSARQALRRLARRLHSTLSSVSSLALGVASITLVFGIGASLLLSPLPGVGSPDHLRIEGALGERDLRVVSHPEFLALETALAGQATVVGSRMNTAPVRIGETTRMRPSAAVTGAYFRALGVRMTLGRPMEPGEDLEAVISHALWVSALGSNPGVLGNHVRIRGLDFVIVGVADPRFQGTFPGFPVQVWVGMEHLSQIFPGDGSLTDWSDRFIHVLGVPTEHATPLHISARLEALSTTLSGRPDWPEGRIFRVASARGVHPSLKAPVAAVVAGLGGVALLVLLVACSNVAIIASALGTERRAEYALQAALGASRRRLLVQPLCEAAILGVLAFPPAALLTLGAAELLSRVSPPGGPPIELPIGADPSVLAFALLAGVSCSVLFSTLPAWRAGDLGNRRVSLGQDLDAPGRSRGTHRYALIAAQTGGTCLLLIGAILLLRSVSNLTTLSPGFDRDRIVTVTAETDGIPEAGGRAYWSELGRIAEGIGGVEGAALGLFPHLGGRSDRAMLRTRSQDPGSGHPVHYSLVGPGYFELLGIAPSSGVVFEAEGASDEAIVNDVLARELWPDRNPLGQDLRVELRGESRAARVIGVVESVKYRRLNEPSTPFLYLPETGWYRPDQTLHVRTAANPRSLIRELQERLSGVDPDVPIEVLPMSDLATMEANLARLLRVILTICGAIAMIVAAAGVTGVAAYVTTTRSKEMAVRRALGATRGQATWTVLRGSVAALGVGAILGALSYVPAGRALRAFLFGVSAADPLVLVAVPFALTLVGTAAAWWASEGAATESINAALRSD